jgi:CRISPR/Cas system endoribonuclease Cas6 (RAMP superfamily)
VVEEGTQPRFSSSFGEKLADRTTTNFFSFLLLFFQSRFRSSRSMQHQDYYFLIDPEKQGNAKKVIFP